MIPKILYGYLGTQCLYVVAKLNIADHLKYGSKEISDLAKLTNSNENALYRVMRCLASLGIFQETLNKSFSLNKEAKDLVSTSENTWKDFIILVGEELYQSAGDLLYSVKTGKPALNHLYGMSHWDYLQKNPNKAEIFHNAMEKGTGPLLKKLIKHYDFSHYKTIVDVGGGKGHLLCEILSQNPAASGIVFDLDNAKKSAEKFIVESVAASRCKFVSGNFFICLPDKADIYLLKVVLHDWDDESVVQILKNCKSAVNKNGRVLIIEKIIEDNRYKELSCLSDINMLVTLTGKERCLKEFQDLLSKSGLKFIQRIDTETVFSIIEAAVA